MKNKFLFVSIFLFVFILNAQTTYVPDDNFEQRLIDLGYDDVLDDYVFTANISEITSLVITNKSISDATGLEDFASLTSFQCGQNQIMSLNFHPNVNLTFFICQNNPLTDLDLSQHTNLDEFSCTNTNITSLDLSQNTNLHYLYCGSTPLTSLDLSNNTRLWGIEAANSNLEYVDLRNGSNEGIDDVDFLNSPNLPFIYVDDCNYSISNWSNIDPSSTFVEMEGQTECAPLAVADFSKNIEFNVYPNPVTNILHLQNFQNIEIKKIEILDMFGKRIETFTSEFNSMEIRNLQSGLYFLNITSDYGTVTKKIIRK